MGLSLFIFLWLASPLVIGLWSGVLFKTSDNTEEATIRLLAARAFGLFCVCACIPSCVAVALLMWASHHNWKACGSTRDLKSCDNSAIVLVFASPVVTFLLGFCLYMWSSHRVLNRLGEESPLRLRLSLVKTALGWSFAFAFLVGWLVLSTFGQG